MVMWGGGETHVLESGCRIKEAYTSLSSPVCYRKGDPFQGLRVGSCLTLVNELSEKTHMLTKQETLL